MEKQLFLTLLILLPNFVAFALFLCSIIKKRTEQRDVYKVTSSLDHHDMLLLSKSKYMASNEIKEQLENALRLFYFKNIVSLNNGKASLNFDQLSYLANEMYSCFYGIGEEDNDKRQGSKICFPLLREGILLFNIPLVAKEYVKDVRKKTNSMACTNIRYAFMNSKDKKIKAKFAFEVNKYIDEALGGEIDYEWERERLEGHGRIQL